MLRGVLYSSLVFLLSYRYLLLYVVYLFTSSKFTLENERQKVLCWNTFSAYLWMVCWYLVSPIYCWFFTDLESEIWWFFEFFQSWILINICSHNQGYKYILSQMVKFQHSGKVLSLSLSLCLLPPMCVFVCTFCCSQIKEYLNTWFGCILPDPKASYLFVHL